MATSPATQRTDANPEFGPLLGRFVLAGLVAGVLSGVWELLVTERAIAPALDLEEARAAAEGDAGHHSEEVFGRVTQTVGGFLGTVIAAVVFATVVAVVFALVRHRLPARSDVGRMIVLAGIGFSIFALLPAVKIPANPPAVGDPDTVGTRTAIYAAVLGGGVVIALVVSVLVGAMRARGFSTSALAAAGSALVVVLVALLVIVLPDNPDTISADVPAAVVWNFRLASLGQLAVLWASLGLAGGWLADRLVHRRAGQPA